ncbi:MAG: 6-carboxytetrahydropterin synthase [Bacteroidetes bacterium]|nr:6-carboxytetrahydropterin synthase [Bacteroidota bacterium]MBP6401476.1 6-carboxytetrahydropterin synthase [Bacteroidia bacterium]
MVYITRKETFSAAHKLTRPDWSLEKNEEVFGKCLNPNWHGHNYQLWVTVKGEINPETGFVTNLAEISLLLKHYVLDKVDHKNLNMDVDFMKGKLSSTEVLAVEIWKQIENPIVKLGCQLHSIKIQETDKNFIEYFGN